MNRALSAALVALALLAGCTPARSPCPPSQIKCGDRCVDQLSDGANCGTCGNACATGSSCCGGACVDVQTSATSCGGCGQSCGTGTCSGGTCSCPNGPSDHCAADPWPWCRDLTRDALHCGDCATACTQLSHETCGGGACGCFDPAHPTTCAAQGACSDLAIDPQNCGTCGVACTLTGKTRCAGGGCACNTAGLTDCTALGAPGCFDLQTNAAHCGGCGVACSAGAACCAGTCTAVATDTSNCGTCGHACAAGQTCSSGSCGCSGATPRACGGSCCGGTACCGAGSTTCQTAHTNGLGGTFFDCNPLYAPSQTTLEAARAAANAFGTGADILGLCDGSCLARQNTSANTCAIWCYGLSAFAGHATSGATINCAGLCLDFQSGPTPVWK